MIIKTLNMGAFQVNNYLVIDEEAKEAVLIDAGGDYNMTVKAAEECCAKIKYILNTHAHMDHIAGTEEIQRKEGARMFLHKDDEFMISVFKDYLSMFGMPDYNPPIVDEFVEDGQELNLGNLKFKVVHTPGHSPGGVCYLIDNILFSGDTLFAQSVGRTDLPGGDYKQLESSIRERIYTLDDEITVYPGHGRPTTVGEEKRTNPFFSLKQEV